MTTRMGIGVILSALRTSYLNPTACFIGLSYLLEHGAI